MGLSNVAEGHVLNWITGNSTTAPTLPLEVRLMTTNGDDAGAGIEVVGGLYAPATVAFDVAPSGGPTSNTATLTFDELPAVTLAGFEIWDAAGVRWHWAAFDDPIVVEDGQPAEFIAGQLQITAD